jgi:hypothetical protein
MIKKETFLFFDGWQESWSLNFMTSWVPVAQPEILATQKAEIKRIIV